MFKKSCFTFIFVIMFIDNTFSQANNKNMNVALEKELLVFYKMGFKPSSISDFLKKIDDFKEYKILEEYSSVSQLPKLYFILGSKSILPPYDFISDRCYSFDTENLESASSVKEILVNMSRITRGELIINNIRDNITYDEETDRESGSVSFEIGNDSYTWEIKMAGYRVDPEIFTKISSLANKYKTKGKFTYASSNSFDFILGFETQKDFAMIRKKMGININWLK